MSSDDVKQLEVIPEPLEKQSLISGSISTVDGSRLSYWPIEVSQFSLSIITDANPDEVQVAILAAQRGQIDLMQISSAADYRATGYSFVRFKARRNSMSIEDALRLVPELKGWNDQIAGPIKLPSQGSYVRAARFDVEHELGVKAKTFGTSTLYPLEARNVSKSGILLTGKGEIPPFKEGTILEITIDPKGNHFSHPVSCLAKVVRFDTQTVTSETAHVKEVNFALQLIELDQSTSNLWSDFVDQVEDKIHRREK